MYLGFLEKYCVDETERAGFEPAVGFKGLRLVSSEFLSATQAPLHVQRNYTLFIEYMLENYCQSV